MKFNFFKNKKGNLLTEETLKMVIAVICIGFLVVFLFSLYSSSQKNKNLEFAETSLNYLIDSIKFGNTEIEIYNPKNWFINIWPQEVNIGGFLGIGSERQVKVPDSCLNVGWENCICICKKNKPEECDKNGFCLNNEFGLDIENKNIKIQDVPLIIEVKDNVLIKK